MTYSEVPKTESMMEVSRAALLLVVFSWAVPSTVPAEIQEEILAYEHGGTSLEGVIFYNDATTGERPGVLVVHEWWGLNDYAKRRARQLAELGYAAFAVDMYGKGKVTTHPEQAGEWVGIITANTERWQKRAVIAHELLKAHPRVDAGKTAAIGYCFGGASVMQLAYSGSDVLGVVSFHGSLPVPTPAEASAITARIMVQHGAADSFVRAERVADFQAALDSAGVDWQMTYHAGARHSFTNPAADAAGMDGLRYDAKADRRSWAAMRTFFSELFES